MSQVTATSLLRALTPSSTLQGVSTYWTTIIRLHFPSQNYSSPENTYSIFTNFNPISTTPLITSSIFQTQNPEFPEPAFFYLQYRAAPPDGIPFNWTATEELLFMELCVAATRQRQGGIDRALWGAIAVGPFVRFYEWEEKGRVMKNVLVNGKQILHVGEDAALVHSQLLFLFEGYCEVLED